MRGLEQELGLLHLAALIASLERAQENAYWLTSS
jgi:hypothetical protein